VNYTFRDQVRHSGSSVWQQISVVTDELSSHFIEEIFSMLGAASVTFIDAADQALYEPPPGCNPLWRQTRIIGLFDAAADLLAIRQVVSAQLVDVKLGNWQTETLPDLIWERVWLENFHPTRFGTSLWVCPTGHEPPDDATACLVLDPGLAFGTGTHPTTALCLEWLAGFDLRGLQMIDYGCGSGILAIAAVLLGADQVFAVDIDEQAFIATCDNARKNKVEKQIQCCTPAELPSLQADLIVANILAQPLCELAPIIKALVRPGGQLVLSGILQHQVDGVLAAYANEFSFKTAKIQATWARLNGARREFP